MPAAAATVIAIISAVIGVVLAGRNRARFLVPLSGVLLAGVAAFGLIPEIAVETGWAATLAIAGAGYLGLHLLEHFGYPVCPSCSDHAEFAWPLVGAVAVHAFVDGWGMVAVANRGAVAGAIVTAMLVHKVPEGLALGTMLRAWAPRSAILLAVATEIPTMLGGAAGLRATPVHWVNVPLAVAAGMFLFLGIHAIIPKR